MKQHEIDERINEIRSQILELADKDELTDEEEARWADLNTEFDTLDAQAKKLEERRSQVARLGEQRTEGGDPTFSAPQVMRKVSPFDVLEDRSATATEVRDANLKVLEERVADGAIDAESAAEAAKIFRKHSRDTDWARNVLTRSTPLYESAFAKYATGMQAAWTPEEARTIVVGTDTSGGFLVPTVIDPTLIYTNTGSDNVIRQISRVVTLTGNANAVNVISSAGVTASWDPELTEVSDDSPEIARPNIPIHKAAAFVQASIEATQDLGGFFDEIGGLFADAKDRLEGAAFAVGSGSNQPTGIFTALDANTNVELTSTTAATIGEVDLHTVYRSLGQRWRSRASWLANPLYALAIKRLGTAVSSSFTGDLRSAPTDMILGRPWYVSDHAPTTQTTTALDNELIFGDFSNYVIAQKPASMAVEFIPHLFGTTNNRPIGARGWYCYWRAGADSVNDSAFRLLQDKTSA